MAKCPMCGGPGMLMGVLGCLKWFTCRDCGMQYSRESKPRKKSRKKEGGK